jgi:hypothetical protein
VRAQAHDCSARKKRRKSRTAVATADRRLARVCVPALPPPLHVSCAPPPARRLLAKLASLDPAALAGSRLSLRAWRVLPFRALF